MLISSWSGLVWLDRFFCIRENISRLWIIEEAAAAAGVVYVCACVIHLTDSEDEIKD